MLPYIEKFERVIINTLLILMTSVVVLGTIELAWILVMDVITPPMFLSHLGACTGPWLLSHATQS